MVSCCQSSLGFCHGTKPLRALGSTLVRSLFPMRLVWEFPNSFIFLGSIQFSILAGRILFKDLRYHTSNQTIRLVKGQLSWRYWIRKPTEEDDLRYARVGAEDVGRESGLSSVLMHCPTMTREGNLAISLSRPSICARSGMVPLQPYCRIR